MNKHGPKRTRVQTPHPKWTGYSTTHQILDNPEKTAAWQKRWQRDFAHRWEERGGKLYPRESNA